jgi:glycosyltransferase involved in cell wall biosynthesis
MSGLRVVMLLENNPYPADVRVRNEAEALARAGHRVTVLAPRAGGQPRRERVGGVDVERFWLPAGAEGVAGLLWEYAVAHVQLYLRAVRRLLRGAGVVHLHNPPDTLFGVAVIARLLGRGAVFDHHDDSPLLFEAKFGGSPVVRVLRWARRASVRAADSVVVTNETQADDVRALGARRVAVVRNGPRTETLVAHGSVRPGVLTDPRLVFLGTLAAQDGVDDLPALMRELIDTHGLAGARLTVIGDGPRRAALESAFAEEGLTPAVDMPGWVPHERVPELLGAADVCVDPAPCTELNHRSTMIKIAEYLAAGRPTVAYALRETERTAADAALIAPCGDRVALAGHVARLAGDPDLRADLAKRGLERAGDLVWERSEKALLVAYGELAATLGRA